MAVTARKDWDRLVNALAAGNVISGANTLSGTFGKDVPGVAPNKVTHIQFGANAPIAVPAGGIDIAGTHGTLHINPDGSYTYQRTLVWVGDVTPGSTDVFTYTLTDKNNATSTTTLTIEVLPESVATPDSKGVHKGTAFDDYINGDDYNVRTVGWPRGVRWRRWPGHDRRRRGRGEPNARRQRQRLPDRQQRR